MSPTMPFLTGRRAILSPIDVYSSFQNERSKKPEKHAPAFLSHTEPQLLSVALPVKGATNNDLFQISASAAASLFLAHDELGKRSDVDYNIQPSGKIFGVIEVMANFFKHCLVTTILALV